MRNVNPLAALVLLIAGVLTAMGKVPAESFLLLATGLAIPARTDGYQSTGTGTLKVEGVEGGEPVVTVDEAG